MTDFDRRLESILDGGGSPEAFADLVDWVDEVAERAGTRRADTLVERVEPQLDEWPDPSRVVFAEPARRYVREEPPWAPLVRALETREPELVAGLADAEHAHRWTHLEFRDGISTTPSAGTIVASIVWRRERVRTAERAPSGLTFSVLLDHSTKGYPCGNTTTR